MKYYIDNTNQTVEPFSRPITVTDTQTDFSGTSYEAVIRTTTFGMIEAELAAQHDERDRRIAAANEAITLYNSKKAERDDIFTSLNMQTIEDTFVTVSQTNQTAI